MRRIAPLLAAIAVALFPAAAGAAVVKVDAADQTTDASGCGSAANPCGAIQAGVDAAAAGDTVSVAAGSYAERILISKQLALVGAQEGVDARGREAGGESVISSVDEYPILFDSASLRITADDVSVDGFTVDPVPEYYGLVLEAGADRFTLANTAVTGGTTGLYAGGNDEVTVTRSRFEGHRYGVYGRDDPMSAVDISENAFSGVLYKAIGIADADLVDIFGNTSDGSLMLDLVSDLAIVGNQIVGPDSFNGSALAMSAVEDVQIVGNVLSDGAATGVLIGSFSGDAATPSKNVDILSNTIVDNTGFGVAITENQGDKPTYVGALEMHYNRIARNGGPGAGNRSYAIYPPDDDGTSPPLFDPAVIGAEDNWWGCNEGPDDPDCQQVEGEVYPYPNLLLRTAADRTVLSPGGRATVTADLGVDSDGVTQPRDLLPDAPLAFSASGGSLSATQAELVSGKATTIFTALGGPGSRSVLATLDGAKVSTGFGASGEPGKPPAPPAPRTTRTTGITSLGVLRASSRVRRGRVRLRLRCRGPVGATCSGRLKLTSGRRRRLVAQRAFTLRAGQQRVYGLRLSRAARKHLRQARAITLTARLSGTAGGRRLQLAKRLAFSRY